MTLRIVVDGRVRLDPAGLPPEAERALRLEFTHSNPEARKDPTCPAWEVTCRTEAGLLTFPRGGLHRVRRILSASGVDFKLVDSRAAGKPLESGGKAVAFRRELWPHQAGIVRSILEKQNCLVRASTGSGKTSAAIAAACAAGRWTIAVVRSRALLDQWVERIASDTDAAPEDVGVVQGKARSLRPFTVAMGQTLHQWPLAAEEMAAFGFIVVDEVQAAPAKTLFSAVDPFPAKYRVGVSADETRSDGKEYLTYDLFGQVAADFGRERAEAEGVVHGVQVAVVPTGFRCPGWYRTALASGNPHRQRGAMQKLAGLMAADQGRNELAARIAAREAREDHVVAVLVGRRDSCVRIAHLVAKEGLRVGTMLGGAPDKEEFDDAKERVRRRALDVVVGTVQAIGTGVDAPTFDRGVVTTHLSNNRQLMGQVRGRFCRRAEGKGDARLYYLLDEEVYGKKAVRNIAAWNEDVVVLDGDAWVSPSDWLSAPSPART